MANYYGSTHWLARRLMHLLIYLSPAHLSVSIISYANTVCIWLSTIFLIRKQQTWLRFECRTLVKDIIWSKLVRLVSMLIIIYVGVHMYYTIWVWLCVHDDTRKIGKLPWNSRIGNLYKSFSLCVCDCLCAHVCMLRYSYLSTTLYRKLICLLVGQLCLVQIRAIIVGLLNYSARRQFFPKWQSSSTINILLPVTSIDGFRLKFTDTRGIAATPTHHGYSNSFNNSSPLTWAYQICIRKFTRLW